MKQTAEELERGYDKPDPWGYKKCIADHIRRDHILRVCHAFAPAMPYQMALDLCCGEGWISQALPAKVIHGFELSLQARKRFPLNVLPVHLSTEVPDMKPWAYLCQDDQIKCPYDLILCTGALYSHYDWELFVQLMAKHALAGTIIVTCSIAPWEEPKAIADIQGFAKQVYEFEFPYDRPEANYTQRLRVFKA